MSHDTPERSQRKIDLMSRFAIACAAVLTMFAAPVTAEPYRVGPGDVLVVSTLGHPNLTGAFRVRDTGEIALHAIGRVEVTGMTLSEIEGTLVRRVSKAFDSDTSVIVEIEAYRNVYILGDVETPGAYPFEPGMTALKGLAIAGGFRRDREPTGSSEVWRVADAQRRMVQAKVRVDTLSDNIAAINRELARIGLHQSDEVPGNMPADDLTRMENRWPQDEPQDALVALRVIAFDRSVESAERQARLAGEEAASFAERREIISRQLAATKKQLENVRSLIERGLARSETMFDLEVEADDFRADELQAAAYEARAKQTEANAESDIALLETRHRQELLEDLVAATEKLAIEEAEYGANASFLREFGGTTLALTEPETSAAAFQVQRGEETISATTVTALQPDDVLVVRVESLIQ
jgi:protein involved in polysaccharide export with SLBB domain